MKKLFILILCAMMLSCMTQARIIRTGGKYPPLDEKETVKIYSIEPPNNFEEIGIAYVTGAFDELRIDRAKEIARSLGGNGIYFKETNIKTYSKTETNAKNETIKIDYDTEQVFIIIRTRSKNEQ
jgi:hypothetical protein